MVVRDGRERERVERKKENLRERERNSRRQERERERDRGDGSVCDRCRE